MRLKGRDTMKILIYILDIVFNLEDYLEIIIFNFGHLAYILMFSIVFLETGIILTPFLPGNSLMFIAGTFASLKIINLYALMGTLILASVLGGIVNYHIGKFLGLRILKSKIGYFILKKGYLDKAKNFYKKNGGKTLIIARYIPVIRTFIPFIAGLSDMRYSEFFLYNIIGGILWIVPLNLAGYCFGNLNFVKDNYSIVIFTPLLIYIICIIIGFLVRKIKKKASNA